MLRLIRGIWRAWQQRGRRKPARPTGRVWCVEPLEERALLSGGPLLLSTLVVPLAGTPAAIVHSWHVNQENSPGHPHVGTHANQDGDFGLTAAAEHAHRLNALRFGLDLPVVGLAVQADASVQLPHDPAAHGIEKTIKVGNEASADLGVELPTQATAGVQDLEDSAEANPEPTISVDLETTANQDIPIPDSHTSSLSAGGLDGITLNPEMGPGSPRQNQQVGGNSQLGMAVNQGSVPNFPRFDSRTVSIGADWNKLATNVPQNAGDSREPAALVLPARTEATTASAAGEKLDGGEADSSSENSTLMQDLAPLDAAVAGATFPATLDPLEWLDGELTNWMGGIGSSSWFLAAAAGVLVLELARRRRRRRASEEMTLAAGCEGVTFTWFPALDGMTPQEQQ
jgi:hypothetical protein